MDSSRRIHQQQKARQSKSKSRLVEAHKLTLRRFIRFLMLIHIILNILRYWEKFWMLNTIFYFFLDTAKMYEKSSLKRVTFGS